MRRTTLRAVTDGLPELSQEVWNRLGAPSILRTLLLAHAATIAGETVVASVWEDSSPIPRGVGFGLLLGSGDERSFAITRTAGIAAGAAITSTCADGPVLTVPADDEDILRALIETLIAHARESGARRITLGYTPATLRLVRVAEACGFRTLSAVGYSLQLPSDCTFARYVAGLDRNRRNSMRRDLGRLEEAGVVLMQDVPSNKVLDECWPLYVSMLRRRGSPLEFRRNFLAELLERASAENISFAWAASGGRTLGYALGVREHGWATALHFGHVDEPSIQLFVALGAWWIRREIMLGSRVLFLGITNDTWKRRVGCGSLDFRFGFLPGSTRIPQSVT